ncbi:Heat shock protein70, partial [Phytophthora megakarya]
MLHYPLAMFMFWKHLGDQQGKLDDDQSTFVLEGADSQGGSRAYMATDTSTFDENVEEPSQTTYNKMPTSSTSARRPKGAAALGAVNIGSLLLLLGGVFAVVAALLARQGFTGRDHVVGIDLGTTYSVVAISQKNNVTAIADREGHALVPSTVAFLPDGEVLVGREARAHRTTDPQHTIFNAKRFIGQ